MIFIISTASYAETIKYRDDIKPKHHNSVWKKQYAAATRIDYDPEKDTFDFYIKESLYLVGFRISRDQADTLIASIDKYKEWNLKASKKGVTLEKEIGLVSVSGTFWKVGNGDWSFGNSTNITMQFFSQTTQKHQLVVLFPKFTGKHNEYSSHKPDELYFDFKEAMKLRNSLTEEAISTFLVKAKKQAEIDAEFN